MKKTTGAASAVLVGALAAGGIVAPATAEAALYKSDTLKIFADFRLRYENDFDSDKTSGAERDERERVRIRGRLGAYWMPGGKNGTYSFGARLRTGSDDSQQSPHWTIHVNDGISHGDRDINLDKYYAKGKWGNSSAWVGRNGLGIYKNNEMFWDDDVTVLGINASHKHDLGNGNALKLNLGHARTPYGMHDWSGTVSHAQLVFTSGNGLSFASYGGGKLTLAAGYFYINGDGGDKQSGMFLRGNGDRDYKIFVGNIKWQTEVMGIPLTLGADGFHNSENYSSSDINDDEVDGYVVQATLGKVKKPWDVQVGVYYADIDKYAVNNSFAQDDWMRWGSATQTRGSGFDGYELRGVVGILKNMKMVARYYDVEATQKIMGASNKEDGRRFRVDFNFKF